MSREEIEQERLKQKEKLEKYEKCVEMIKDLLPKTNEHLTHENLEGLVEEIKYLIGELEDAY